jgi:hypothetical protein
MKGGREAVLQSHGQESCGATPVRYQPAALLSSYTAISARRVAHRKSFLRSQFHSLPLHDGSAVPTQGERFAVAVLSYAPRLCTTICIHLLRPLLSHAVPHDQSHRVDPSCNKIEKNYTYFISCCYFRAVPPMPGLSER